MKTQKNLFQKMVVVFVLFITYGVIDLNDRGFSSCAFACTDFTVLDCEFSWYKAESQQSTYGIDTVCFARHRL